MTKRVLIQPPSYLPEEAVEYFNEALEQLGDKALPSDRGILAEYAHAQADVIRLTEMVMFEGETLFSDKGNAYVNPTLSILIARRKDLERARNDLGMTPKARGVKGPGKTTSKLAAAMGRG